MISWIDQVSSVLLLVSMLSGGNEISMESVGESGSYEGEQIITLPSFSGSGGVCPMHFSSLKKKKGHIHTYFQIHIHCGNFQIPQCYLKAIIPLNLIIPIRVRFICVKHPYVEPGWVQTSLPSGCTIEISGKESVFPFLCMKAMLRWRGGGAHRSIYRSQ